MLCTEYKGAEKTTRRKELSLIWMCWHWKKPMMITTHLIDLCRWRYSEQVRLFGWLCVWPVLRSRDSNDRLDRVSDVMCAYPVTPRIRAAGRGRKERVETLVGIYKPNGVSLLSPHFHRHYVHRTSRTNSSEGNLADGCHRFLQLPATQFRQVIFPFHILIYGKELAQQFG